MVLECILINVVKAVGDVTKYKLIIPSPPIERSDNLLPKLKIWICEILLSQAEFLFDFLTFKGERSRYLGKLLKNTTGLYALHKSQ